MLTVENDDFYSLLQVKLFNDEKERDSKEYQSYITKPLDQIKIMNESIPFFADVNKDGYTDILYNDHTSKKLTVALYNLLTEEFDILLPLWETFISSHENCAKPNKKSLLHVPHSSIVADFNNDCVGDLFLTLDNTAPAMLFALISTTKSITYCLTDLSGTYLDELSGHLVADFN